MRNDDTVHDELESTAREPRRNDPSKASPSLVWIRGRLLHPPVLSPAAGHGPSALPQRACATLNYRIVPGYTANDMLQTLREAIADPGVEITWQFNEPHDPPASPLREDVFGAVTEVAHRMWPGVIVMPGMETGMADSRILRVVGIPSYGVSGLFVEQGDGRAHGKDERIRASDFYAGVDFYDQFMKALVR